MSEDFSQDEIEAMLFGREGEERHAYDAVWVDHFWDDRIEGTVFAATIDEAIERGLAGDAEGLPIDTIQGPDGQAFVLSGGHTVRAARVLIETEGRLVEETIAALTWEMAIDIAELMFGPHGEVLGIQEGAERRWLFPRDDAFRARPDLPVGWY